jgi:hypothetical protein
LVFKKNALLPKIAENCDHNIDHTLVDFYSIRLSFTLASFFLKLSAVAHIFRLLFHGYSYVLILTKMGWATFWPTFKQTRLVTLVASIPRSSVK